MNQETFSTLDLTASTSSKFSSDSFLHDQSLNGNQDFLNSENAAHGFHSKEDKAFLRNARGGSSDTPRSTDLVNVEGRVLWGKMRSNPKREGSIPAYSSTSLQWTSPFETSTTSFSGNVTSVTNAIAAATEAETQVRRGITVAQSWWPSVIQILRSYFAVSHSSVGKKMLALLLPPIGYLWKLRSGTATKTSLRSTSSDVLDDDVGETQIKDAYDIHHLGPDLYLPLMSFTSYVLLYALAKGTFDDFQPEVLSATASFAAILTAVEALTASTALYLIGVPYIPFLDIVYALGIKYQSLVVIVVTGLVIGSHPVIFWGSFMYCGLCAAHAASLRGSESSHRPQPEWGAHKTVTMAFIYVALTLAVIQVHKDYWLFSCAGALYVDPFMLAPNASIPFQDKQFFRDIMSLLRPVSLIEKHTYFLKWVSEMKRD